MVEFYRKVLAFGSVLSFRAATRGSGTLGREEGRKSAYSKTVFKYKFFVGVVEGFMTSNLAGNLLVASSSIENPLYARSVCLLVHHDPDGAIGLLLNRPLEPQPTELLKLLTVSGGHERYPQTGGTMVHFGGPLSGPVVALHTFPKLADGAALEGVYVAAQKDHLQALLQQTDCGVRLIVGHAGWKAGQLEQEIDRGRWHVIEATSEVVLGSDELMWERLIRRACGRSVARWTGAGLVSAAELN